MPFFCKKFKKIFIFHKSVAFWAVLVSFNCNHTWNSRFLYHFSKKLKIFIRTSRTSQKSFSSAFNNTVGKFKQNLVKFLKIFQKNFFLDESKRKKPLSWRGNHALIAANIIYLLNRTRQVEIHIYSVKRILFFRLYSNIKLGINETSIRTNTLNITDKKLSGEK